MRAAAIFSASVVSIGSYLAIASMVGTSAGGGDGPALGGWVVRADGHRG